MSVIDHPPPTDAKPASASGSSACAEQVVAPTQVLRLLEQWAEDRSFASVRLEGYPETYSSKILRVDRDNQIITLDELRPESGHTRVSIGMRITVSGRLERIPITFDTQVEQIDESLDPALYVLSIPGAIQYLQRRNDYRVRVSRGDPVVVQFSNDDGHEWAGELDDISLGGLGIRMPAEDKSPPSLPRSGEILSCRLELPDIGSIKCCLEVRYAEPNAKTDIHALGVRFTDLNRRDRALIQRFIAQAQRDMARKRPKT